MLHHSSASDVQARPRRMKARGAAQKRVRTPNCTHVLMDLVYGRDQCCHSCGREPSLGFLYICKQDDHYPLEGLQQQREVTSTAELGGKSALRVELEEIGMSQAVIRAAERGEYTPAQLEKLKALKLEMKQVIADVQQANQINAMVEQLSNNDGTSHSVSTPETPNAQSDPIPPVCEYRACHNCRPYYRDRMYSSFEAVVNDKESRLTAEDVEDLRLPTKSAHVLRFIGLHPNPLLPMEESTLISEPTFTTFPTDVSTELTPSGASILTFKTTQSDTDELSKMRRPHRRFYSVGFKGSGDIAHDLARLGSTSWRHGLKSAIQGIFRSSHWRESSSSGSNITLPLPRTGTKRNLAEGITNDFDLGTLRRVRKQKERADLRNGIISQGFEDGRMRSAGTHGDATLEGSEDSIGNFSLYSCVSEGSEVEVEGGVALTEEAVETHIPDILQVQGGSIVGVGAMDSIMTQV